MYLDLIINFLTPYSEQYGTANAHVDLLIICAGLSIVCLLFVVKLTFLAANQSPSVFNQVLYPTADLKPLVELSKQVDKLINQAELFRQYIKHDLGYVCENIKATQKDLMFINSNIGVAEFSRRDTMLFRAGKIQELQQQYRKVA